ncbi:protein gustavus-like [Mya arenaria]|nr:protein gustavus-like [Mya arenaria]
MIALVALCAHSAVHVGDPIPAWVLQIQHDRAVDVGMASCSPGIGIANHNTITRHRKGHFETDGARWGVALSKGKHVFEIVWPNVARDATATVGVGTEEAPLYVKPRDPLVGGNRHSWGYDIARCKALHKKEILATYPATKSVPDKFYLYVDCDSGSIALGTDGVYWGARVLFPISALPVYPMLGIVCEGAHVTMTYRGSAYAGGPSAVMSGMPSVDLYPPGKAGYPPQKAGYQPPGSSLHF